MTSVEIQNLVERQKQFYKSGATLSVSFRIEQLKKLYGAVKKYETEDDLLSYVFILTTECNLTCSYCYERNIKNKTTIQNTELLVEHIIKDIEISHQKMINSKCLLIYV